MLDNAIKFVYGSVRANEAAGALNRMDDYQGLDSTIQLDENYNEAMRRYRNPYSPLSDQRFEEGLDNYNNLAFDRTVTADPSFAGVARSASRNQEVRNRNRRAMGGSQLSAQYLGVANSLAQEYQRLGDETVSTLNERFLREEIEAGKAYRDATNQAVEGATGMTQPLDNLLAKVGGEEDEGYKTDEVFDEMPEDMDSDMAFGDFGGFGGFG